MGDRAFPQQQRLFVTTVPGQPLTTCQQPHLDRGFVATGAHTLISTRAAAARLIRGSAAAGAGYRQRRITIFPVRVAAAAGCGLLRVGPAHRRPATGGWNIGKLVASHDARSISGSSNIIAAVWQRPSPIPAPFFWCPLYEPCLVF